MDTVTDTVGRVRGRCVGRWVRNFIAFSFVLMSVRPCVCVNNTSAAVNSSSPAVPTSSPVWTFKRPQLYPKEPGCPRLCANVTATYMDNSSQANVSETFLSRCGRDGRVGLGEGWGVHVVAEDGGNHACTPVINKIHGDKHPWVALVQRGDCKFTEKIWHAAVLHNASAVVVYNNQRDATLVIMAHNVSDEMAVFTSAESGARLVALIDNGTDVWLSINVPDSCDLYAGLVVVETVERMNVGTLCGIIISMIAIVVVVIVVVIVLVKKDMCWNMKNRNAGIYRFRNLM